MSVLLKLYIAVVALSGLAVLFDSAAEWLPMMLGAPAPFWLFALLLVATERIAIPRNDPEGESNVSTTFGFAILMVYGLPAAVTTQAVASFIADAFQRKPMWKTAFNLGQLSLAFAAAGAVMDLFPTLPTGGSLRFSEAQLPGIFASAATFFVTNLVLNGIALALALRRPVLRYIFDDLVMEAPATGALLLIAPLLVGIAHFSLFLAGLVVVPLLGVWVQGRLTVRTMELALNDPLTGMLNRTALTQQLDLMLASAREDTKFSVMLLDVDRFREINDTLGHDRGEEVLREVGRRLSTTVAGAGSIARFGGDEFCLLMPGASRAEAARLAEKLLFALDRPLDLEGLPLHLAASIGIATYPEHAADPNTLLRHADVAMYVAKEKHTGYAVYRPEFHKHTPSQLAMVAELKSAIEAVDELFVHYQPKVEITSGEVVGAETLIRWNHPSLGLLYPDAFISLAERTGQIKPLTSFVLAEAVAQCGLWGGTFSVAVNLSARNLLDHQLVKGMETLLEATGANPAKVTVEITESSLMIDPQLAQRLLEGLQGLGIKLAIDDFGTGYSSLAYLKRLPVSELKIDKSFVMAMTKDENDMMIVRSVIELGHNLGLKVVAEGVSDTRTYNVLGDLGCDMAQGYLFSQALSVEEFERWVKARRAHVAAESGQLLFEEDRPFPEKYPTHLNSLARRRSIVLDQVEGPVISKRR